MKFRYRGVIPASKSILNRLLILQSFEPHLKIESGESQADDVIKMRSALKSLLAGEPADCGAAGTTLRFLALRASRLPGRHNLVGTRRLLERPQDEIIKILKQLGCQATLSSESLLIEGNGWKIPDRLRIDRSISSQFASALILSAWRLPEPLILSFEGDEVSEGYLQMTLELVQRAGMKWERTNNELRIPANSRIGAQNFEAESDLSSAFAVAALAAISGEAVFENWPQKSLQPDSVFPEILEKMGARITREGNSLAVRSGQLRAIDQDLRNAPDLFPVLSVLCAVAHGTSILRGAPHLAHKESSRIEKSAELVRAMGAEVYVKTDGMQIRGVSQIKTDFFKYDPEHDHRLAMAAAAAKLAGAEVEILHPEVVDKSFPQFWSVFREGLVQ